MTVPETGPEMRNRQRLELFAAPSTIRFAILRSPLTDLVRSVSERSHRLAMAKEDLRSSLSVRWGSLH